MGFCEQNAVHDIDNYERAFVEEIGKQVCPTLGQFETLCQQVVQGDSKQVQAISPDDISIDDFLQPCEEKADEKNGVAVMIGRCCHIWST